jgi:acyl-CoA reductase-like NAD-dependent aldehyde dehydrogenase
MSTPEPVSARGPKAVRDSLREHAASGLIECYEPATRLPLGTVPVDDPEAVRAIVARAREAQRRWAQAPFTERRRVLGLILDHVLEHADELVDAIARDSGKTRHNAFVGEIWPVAEKLRWTLAHGEKHLAPERASSGLLVHKRARVEFPPLGVIGVIAPWNYPLQNVLGPTIPALMAGNAVVIKVSEWVAWSAARFQRIFDEAFTRAGYPRELVRLVNGYAETGAALIGSGVDKVIFTGSLENGRRVMAEASKTLTPVVLELGGKDPLVVCDDAHLEQAAHAALVGSFINAGQNCLASERCLVMEPIYERFVQRVTELGRGLRQGDPLGGHTIDVGAIVSPLQLELIEELVDDAVKHGARVLTGGRRAPGTRGQFFEPTILADVTPAMRIAQEETFGPVMLLMKVRDDAHALQVANATPFGLGATVLTTDARRARRLTSELVAGQVSVNDFGLTYMAMDLPFGGVKGSGFGRLNGRDGLRACTSPKAVLEDRLPLHLPAKVFPVGDAASEVAREVLRVIYARGLPARARAAVALARVAVRGRR